MTPKQFLEKERSRSPARFMCMWIDVGELVCGACMAGYVTPTLGKHCDNCGATVDQIEPGQPPFKCPMVIVVRETP